MCNLKLNFHYAYVLVLIIVNIYDSKWMPCVKSILNQKKNKVDIF